MGRSRDYREELLTALQDPEEAKAYLNAALEEEDPEVFLLALRDVTDATIGVGELAKRAERNRESLYKTLSEKGNPELFGLVKIIQGLGFRLSIERQD